MIPCRQDDAGLLFDVYVQPGASRAEPVGEYDGALRVRVRALAEKGKANKALVRLLARWLGVGRRDVAIVHGERSRHKVVHVTGATPGDLQALVEGRSSEG